ncbi:MAG: hypothetical protein JJW03_01475, partial [Desulfosarcina sp.]|nr:hypothetical protein [Desulfobacterales bacterium]
EHEYSAGIGHDTVGIHFGVNGYKKKNHRQLVKVVIQCPEKLGGIQPFEGCVAIVFSHEKLFF